METWYLTIDEWGCQNFFETKKELLDFLEKEKHNYKKFVVEQGFTFYDDLWDNYCPAIYKEISINEL